MRRDITSVSHTNLKMGNETYLLRRQVIDLVYEAKNFLRENNLKLPRIDVRITEKRETNLGTARIMGNMIWIPCSTLSIKNYKKFLRQIVYHEICHASFGTPHIEACQLMKSTINVNDEKPMSKVKTQKAFLKYAA